MAQSAAAPADGSTIVFGQGDPTNNTVAEITSISASPERAAIDITSLGSLSRESVVGIANGGTVDVEFNFVGDDSSQQLLTTHLFAAQATINGSGDGEDGNAGFRQCRINWQTQTANNDATWTFDAVATNFAVSGSEGEKLTGSCTLQISTDGGQAPIAIGVA